jgi:hypothetical protein
MLNSKSTSLKRHKPGPPPSEHSAQPGLAFQVECTIIPNSGILEESNEILMDSFIPDGLTRNNINSPQILHPVHVLKNKTKNGDAKEPEGSPPPDFQTQLVLV